MKTEGLPRFVGNNVASVMRAVGPKGVNFARYSLDYHLLRNYLHVIDEWGEGGKSIVPEYATTIVKKNLETDTSFRERQRGYSLSQIVVEYWILQSSV